MRCTNRFVTHGWRSSARLPSLSFGRYPMPSTKIDLEGGGFFRRCWRVKSVPFERIANWPDYPGQPDIDLQVPSELAKYKFTLMKDTLPNGDVRVGIQCYRYRFLGMGQMMTDGFVVSPDGRMRPLSDEDVWKLT